MIELDSTLDPSEGLALFTDGSAYYKDKSGGWAFIVIDAFEGIYRESGWNKNTTSNQMELMGPTYGLNWVYTYVGPSEVLVYSDSEYVVLGAQDPDRARNKNLTFWQTLDKAIDMHPHVEFIHVKGHADHFWNEMADDLAGKARKNGLNAAQQASRPTARQTDPSTSWAAARLAEATATPHRELAYRLLCAHPEGLTDFELAEKSGLQQTSIGKRRGDLVKLDLARATDRKRRTPSGAMAVVWEAVGR